jgi:hypothetical protein
MIIFLKKLLKIKLTLQEKEKEMWRLTKKYEKYKEARRVLTKELNNA